MSIQHEISNKPHIYLIEEVSTGKKYVGQANGKSEAYFCGGKIIRAAIKKYGKIVFTRKILIEGDFNQDEIDELETKYIELYNCVTPNGYNILRKGHKFYQANNIPWHKVKKGCYSQNTIERMRQRILGNKPSEETRRKQSESLKGRKNSPEAIAITTKALSKSVLQYTLKGEFVREYSSTSSVARETDFIQSAVASCCNGTRGSHGNHMWRYKSGDILLSIDPYLKSDTRQLEVVQKDREGNIIRVWRCCKDISQTLGYDRGGTSTAAKNRVLYNGFLWEYKNTNHG